MKLDSYRPSPNVKDRRLKGIPAREPSDTVAEDRAAKGKYLSAVVRQIVGSFRAERDPERRDPMPAIRKHLSSMTPGQTLGSRGRDDGGSGMTLSGRVKRFMEPDDKLKKIRKENARAVRDRER